MKSSGFASFCLVFISLSSSINTAKLPSKRIEPVCNFGVGHASIPQGSRIIKRSIPAERIVHKHDCPCSRILSLFQVQSLPYPPCPVDHSVIGEESRVRWRVVEVSVRIITDPIVTASVDSQFAWDEVLHRVLEACNVHIVESKRGNIGFRGVH
jgi:hypothetical protein